MTSAEDFLKALAAKFEGAGQDAEVRPAVYHNGTENPYGHPRLVVNDVDALIKFDSVPQTKNKFDPKLKQQVETTVERFYVLVDGSMVCQGMTKFSEVVDHTKSAIDSMKTVLIDKAHKANAFMRVSQFTDRLRTEASTYAYASAYNFDPTGKLTASFSLAIHFPVTLTDDEQNVVVAHVKEVRDLVADIQQRLDDKLDQLKDKS